MEVKELRIGNYIHDASGRTEEIVSIGIALVETGLSAPFLHEVDDLEPIPLTEEELTIK